MKIHVLMENTTDRTDILVEHGLSLYIETKKHKILFDAGQTGDFAMNAERMGVDLGQVDMAFLSHGHYDHSGGLMKFLELNDHAQIYMNRDVFVPHFNGVDRYIGVDRALRKYQDRFVFVEDYLQIDDELEICSCNENERIYKAYSDGLNMLKHGTLMEDDFQHEQYLLVREEEKTVLFSGCSHKGILNIKTWMKADVVIGGFHLMKVGLNEEGAEELKKVAETLASYPAKYYTCHCTGIEQYKVLKRYMMEKLCYLSAGMVMEI